MKKSKKRFSHSVSMGTELYRKNVAGNRDVKGKKRDKKALEDVYNKFYRDQVAALYRAVRGF